MINAIDTVFCVCSLHTSWLHTKEILMKKRLVHLTAIALFSTSIFVMAPSAGASSCGYYREQSVTPFGQSATTHLYNHCGSGNVKIRIDNEAGFNTKCVGPGVTRLGTDTPGFFHNYITNAYYVGKC